MIAAWMAYTVVMGALPAAAAWAVERGLRLLRWQARGVWLGALMTSLVLPVLDVLRATRAVGFAGATVIVPEAIATSVADAVAASSAIGLDQVLTIVWIVSSAVVLSLVLVAQWSLWRDLRGAREMTITGTTVHVTPQLGPAVILGRGIALPEWVFAAAPAIRTLIVRHEQEHADRRDAAVLFAGTLAIVAMPWNLALWWQVRRLRDAVELDCDRRLLDAGVNPVSYAAVLLDVAHRNLGGGLRSAAALLDHPSLLARRVDQMTRPQPGPVSSIVRVAGLVAVGLALTIVACSAPTPREVTPAPASVPQRLSMDVLRYPRLLREAGIEGSVVLEFDVLRDGRVDSASVHIVSSTHRAFERPAADAIRTARYTRTEQGALRIRQTINFILARSPDTSETVGG